MEIVSTSIHRCFQGLNDPRLETRCRHELMPILVISLLAVVAGADSFNDIELFAKSKKDWLCTFLDLPNGIPSHDTFNRVFSSISSEEFSKCFITWTQSLAENIRGVVAIDGKTLRRSFDSAAEPTFLHMVSAWSSENDLVLGQIRTAAKSNEITAIPQLIAMLDLQDSIVTIDAAGCQKNIAQNILDADADYVLALKANQRGTFEKAQSLFAKLKKEDAHDIVFTQHEKTEKNRGRLETRTACSIDVSGMDVFSSWAGLNSISEIISTRETKNHKTTVETRYFISSLPADAESLSKAIRSHWGIENSLHWVLDVVFKEDYARNRKDHSAENMAILRHMAINFIKKETSSKTSIRGKRLKAAWNNDYLIKLLT